MSKKEESESSYEYEEEEEETKEEAEHNKQSHNFDFGVFEDMIKENKVDEATDQLIDTIGTSPTYLEAALGKIINMILKTSYKTRTPYYVAFKELIRKFKGKTRAYDIYKAIRKRCPPTQHVDLKIQRNSCLVTCISCISRAGLFKDNKEECVKELKQVYRITTQAPPIRLLGFEIVLDMIKSNGFTEEEFKENINPIFHGKFDPEEPNNIDLLYFHVSLYKMFPNVEFIDDVKNIAKFETLKKYSEILQGSAKIRNLHPIWELICSYDAKSLYDAACQLWIEGGDDVNSPKQILSHALAAWIPHATNQEIVQLIQNKPVFLSAANASRGQEFRDILSKRLKTIEDEKVEVAVSLLSISEQSNYIMKERHHILSYMDDEQTKTIYDRVKNVIPFDSFADLLSAQKNRKQGKDDALIAKIFDTACSKCKEDAHRKVLSKFYTSVSSYKTPSGSDFLSVLTGSNFTQSSEIKDLKSLISSTNQMLDNIEKIHAKMNIETKVGRCTNLDDFVSLMRDLYNTELPHLRRIASTKVEEGINFLRKEDSDLVKMYPYIIPKALERKELCEAALIYALSNFKELPDRVKEALINLPEIKLPISENEASDLLQNMLRNKEQGAFSERAINSIIDMANAETKVKCAAIRAAEIINENGQAFGAAGIARIIDTTDGAADAVLKAVEENVAKAQMGNNNVVKRVHEWVLSSIGKASDDDVRRVAVLFAKRNYAATPDGNKRLEINMSWVYKVAKHLSVQGEPALYEPLFDLVKDRKSKRAKRFIYHLTGKSAETPKEESASDEEKEE